MLRKKQLLSIIAIALLLGFFLLPANREWAQRVIGYYKDFPSERKHLSREYRMNYRFGNSYKVSKQIADHVAANDHSGQALVLIPPPAYFEKHRIDYEAPEPAVFYYYTGCKTIAPSSVDAINANWYVHTDGQNVLVDSVTDRKSLQDMITAFNKWK
jgi:hypothetical protein